MDAGLSAIRRSSTQPQQRRPHQHLDRSARPAVAKGDGEMLYRPGKSGARTGSHAARDFVEAGRQSTMPRHREAGEVVWPLVYLLNEGNLAVQEALRAQHAVDLRHRAVGIRDVLEHGGGHHRIEGPICERQVVRIAERVDLGAHVHVGRDRRTSGRSAPSSRRRCIPAPTTSTRAPSGRTSASRRMRAIKAQVDRDACADTSAWTCRWAEDSLTWEESVVRANQHGPRPDHRVALGAQRAGKAPWCSR